MVSLIPTSLLSTVNRPLDEKTNFESIAQRDSMPMAHRYRGQVVVVRNTGAERPQIFWLPTDNLTNTGWEEIKIDESSMPVGRAVKFMHESFDYSGSNIFKLLLAPAFVISINAITPTSYWVIRDFDIDGDKIAINGPLTGVKSVEIQYIGGNLAGYVSAAPAIPAPPQSGTTVLQSVNGVLQWA